MTRNFRIKRVAILCRYCLWNCAFYRARSDKNELINLDNNEFWRIVDSNFIDMCVLEWCKLFADERGKHCWKKVITDQTRFLSSLLADLNCTETEFNTYIAMVKHYRDKFVAHLDNENRMDIPNLEWIKKSTLYLYDYLFNHEGADAFIQNPPNLRNEFTASGEKAQRVYVAN